MKLNPLQHLYTQKPKPPEPQIETKWEDQYLDIQERTGHVSPERLALSYAAVTKPEKETK